jgi:hypothetical protein
MRRYSITRHCPVCSATFHPTPSMVSRGKGKFCSRKCYDAAPKPHAAAAERFWQHVAKSEGCWNWQGGCNSKGYGKFTDAEGAHIYAHRYSWELHIGVLREGDWVLHRCDNPRCVCPDHLFLGDNTANSLDREHKGRTARGESMPQARLTAATVLAIRTLHAEGANGSQIAQRLGVSKGLVYPIIKGRTWRHVQLPTAPSTPMPPPEPTPRRHT